MSFDRIIVDAIKVAQDLLCQILPPAHNLTDAATVMRSVPELTEIDVNPLMVHME